MAEERKRAVREIRGGREGGPVFRGESAFYHVRGIKTRSLFPLWKVNACSEQGGENEVMSRPRPFVRVT